MRFLTSEVPLYCSNGRRDDSKGGLCVGVLNTTFLDISGPRWLDLVRDDARAHLLHGEVHVPRGALVSVSEGARPNTFRKSTDREVPLTVWADSTHVYL